jgi:hypothetical protein
MAKRQEFPAKVKVAAFERCKGRCEGCTAPLRPGKFRYDHRIPDALGGKPTLENCQVLCLACDAPKTNGQDIPAIAKANRVRSKFIGAKAPSRRPLPGGKNDKFKRTIGRGTVLR